MSIYMRVYMYMYMGWVENVELATRLITIFGTAQGSRGAFGTDPCGSYVCIHWYWNENMIWLVWAMKRKLKWDMRKRELLYMIDSFGEKGWDLFMIR